MMDCIDIKDERIIQLYCQYGAEGLGVFYYLYGRLMSQSSKLKIEDCAKVSRILRVDECIIKEIINDSGIFTMVDGVIHCKEIDDALSFKKERSELRRMAVQKRWHQKKCKEEHLVETATGVIPEVIVEVVKPQKVKKTLEERCLEFRNSLMPFLSEYGKEMITEFYNYWTEPNPSKTKMRFEMEKTWDVRRRLDTWLKRSLGFNKCNKGKSLSEETEDVVMSAMVELYKRGEITLEELQKERKQLIS